MEQLDIQEQAARSANVSALAAVRDSWRLDNEDAHDEDGWTPETVMMHLRMMEPDPARWDAFLDEADDGREDAHDEDGWTPRDLRAALDGGEERLDLLAPTDSAELLAFLKAERDELVGIVASVVRDKDDARRVARELEERAFDFAGPDWTDA